MNYENLNYQITNINLQRKHFFSIFGLYLFSLGSAFLGYSVYLLMESIGILKQQVITWNAQGLFWFLILFCISIFILFIPIEFLNIFKIYNVSFRDLIINIIIAIFTSLFFLIVFQFLLDPQSKIVNDVIDIGKAISFSGFITVPLVLFLQHNLIRTINLKDSVSYNIVLFAWVMSSQIFL